MAGQGAGQGLSVAFWPFLEDGQLGGRAGAPSRMVLASQSEHFAGTCLSSGSLGLDLAEHHLCQFLLVAAVTDQPRFKVGVGVLGAGLAGRLA